MMSTPRRLIIATAALATAFQASRAAEHSMDSGATPSLAVEADGPAGHVRMQYTPGQGWHVASVQALKKATLPLANSASPDADLTTDPQTLFIDGPSGIVYGYFVERGWGLIGQLSTETNPTTATKQNIAAK